LTVVLLADVGFWIGMQLVCVGPGKCFENRMDVARNGHGLVDGGPFPVFIFVGNGSFCGFFYKKPENNFALTERVKTIF